MKKIKEVLTTIKYNISTLIGFELIFKLLSLMFFTPIFLKSFTLIMKLTGFKYITLENVFTFLFKPVTIVMLIILLLLMMLYTMFDITTIIIILDSSYHKKKIKIMEAIKLSLSKCKKLFKLKNIPIAFLVIFLIPFLNIGISSSFISVIKIPEFILDFIVNNKTLLILYAILVILLLVLLLRWIYALHYFVLEDLSFKESRKKSINLSKKKHLKDLLTLILLQTFLALVYFIFIILGILLIVLFNKLLGKYILLKSLTSTVIWVFLGLSFILMALISTPINYASLSVMYYFHKKENKEDIKQLVIPSKDKKNKNNKILKRVILGFGLASFILATLFTYGLYKGKYNLNIEYVRTLEVTAHRGASKNYPENTMSAFRGAKELGADWIELDVQQTKDGEIIVSHDTNLSRITGINKDIIDLNYEDIKDLDAGSFFDKKYQDERIPLLKDVVKWAKENNMRLNIELKPTGKEHDFEKMVIDIINEYDYAPYCVLTSQVYSVIENAKEYDANIETVYVMSLAVGNIVLLDKADNFSVEASNVNKALVKKVHNEGKKLYVWTINTTENINKMIDYKVDNIITDNITLAKDTIMASKKSNVVNEFIKYIEKILG